MGTPAYTPLAHITLGSQAAGITFSNISQNFRDLVLVMDIALASVNGVVGMTINNDGGSNYSRVYMMGNGSGTASATETVTYMVVNGTTTQLGVGNRSNAVVNFMDYSTTNKHKSVLSRANTPAIGVDAIAGRWASNSPITSFYLFNNFGNGFASGSTFSLYGVLA